MTEKYLNLHAVICIFFFVPYTRFDKWLPQLISDSSLLGNYVIDSPHSKNSPEIRQILS